MPASMSLLAVRGPVSDPGRVICSAFRSWHGRFCTGRGPRGWSIFINAPILRLAIVFDRKTGNCAVRPKDRARWSTRMDWVPLIDIGTLDKIRDCSIKIRGGIDRLTPDGVVFRRCDQRRIRPRDHPSQPDSPRSAPIGSRCGRRVRQAGNAAGDRPGDQRAPGLFLPARSTSTDRTIARDRTGKARRIATFQTLQSRRSVRDVTGFSRGGAARQS